jgi:Chromo (CHRromatin Organisation MOdifier) domain
LAPHYYRPFEIEERVGTVAYQLRLPVGSKIHPVIHVSQLKRHVGSDTNISPTLPISGSDGQLQIYPEYVIARRAIKRGNVAVPQLLIKWTNLSEDDASWEDYSDLVHRFPEAVLEDKNVFEARGVSTPDSVSVIPDQTFSQNEETLLIFGQKSDPGSLSLNSGQQLKMGPLHSNSINGQGANPLIESSRLKINFR